MKYEDKAIKFSPIKFSTSITAPASDTRPQKFTHVDKVIIKPKNHEEDK